MKVCKACDSLIDTKSNTCPQCEEENEHTLPKPKYTIGILTLIILIAIGLNITKIKPFIEDIIINGQMAGDNKLQKRTFAIGELISHEDFDLVVDNLRYVEGPIESKEYVILDVTVTSKKDNYLFNTQSKGVTPDNRLIDSALAMTPVSMGTPITTAFNKPINKGQKAKGYIAFTEDVNKIQLSGHWTPKFITIKLQYD